MNFTLKRKRRCESSPPKGSILTKDSLLFLRVLRKSNIVSGALQVPSRRWPNPWRTPKTSSKSWPRPPSLFVPQFFTFQLKKVLKFLCFAQRKRQRRSSGGDIHNASYSVNEQSSLTLKKSKRLSLVSLLTTPIKPVFRIGASLHV